MNKKYFCKECPPQSSYLYTAGAPAPSAGPVRGRMFVERASSHVSRPFRDALFVELNKNLTLRPVGTACYGTLSKQRYIMANTYTQIYIQFVFAVQGRVSLIHPAWEHELYKYITGIVQNNRHKMIAINGMPNHLHLFVGLRPTQSLSELMRQVKGDSSSWVNQQGWAQGIFRWQAGYGAFSYGRSQIDRVCRYVMNQKEHHRKKTFLEEYLELLDRFDVPYDMRYIFKPIE